MSICFDPKIRVTLQRLGFIEDPFSDFIDTRFLCYTEQHRQVMMRVLDDIQGQASIICVTGEAGTGKSILARRLYQLLQNENKYKTAFYADPQFSTLGSLYLALAYSFNLHVHKEIVERIMAFEDFIDITGNKGALILLIIDNADELGDEDFQSLIKLYKPRTPQEKTVRLVFFGRPTFLSNFSKLHYQRNIDYKSIEILPLSLADVSALINYRCFVGGKPLLFSDNAIEKFHSISKGNPQTIIRLGKLLLYAVAYKQKQFVDSDDIEFTLSLWKNQIDSLGERNPNQIVYNSKDS